MLALRIAGNIVGAATGLKRAPAITLMAPPLLACYGWRWLLLAGELLMVGCHCRCWLPYSTLRHTPMP